MLTTPVSMLAATLVAVTFGWTPAANNAAEETDEPGTVQQAGYEQAGYEYHVRLTPTDLEALRDGRTDSLSSALPEELGKIDRVRITVGEGPAPRELTAVDRAAGKAGDIEPVRRLAAKPVIPDWPAAEKRTAYQNPGEFVDSLERGARNFGRELQDRTRDTTRGVQNALEQTNDNLRRGAENFVRGTGDFIDPLLPGDQSSDGYRAPPAYGGRPNEYDRDRLANPPQPTLAEEDRVFADQPDYNTRGTDYPQQRNGYQDQAPESRSRGYADDPQSPVFREPSRQPQRSVTDGFDNRPFASGSSADRGPLLGGANNRQDYGDPLKRFADDEPSTTARRGMTAVPRRDARPTQFTQADYDRQQRDEWFPNIGDRNTVARPDNTQAANDSGFGSAPPAWNPPRNNNQVVAGIGGGGTTTASNNSPVTNWAGLGNGTNPQSGSLDQPPSNANNNGQTPLNQSGDSSYFEKLLLVILGAVTCFTWVAYLDVRNKYRMALRGVPTAGYGHGVAA